MGAEVWVAALPSLPELRACLSLGRWREFVLAGGDDYELVFTAAPADRARVLAAAEQSTTSVTRVGCINDTGCLAMVAADGGEIILTSLGFDHFG